MDYLRTLGSAAASSILAKSGIALPFSLGDKVSYGAGIWTLYEAIKRDDSSLVSVFFFDASISNQRHFLPLAKNALRKLRTIRHPDVLKFIDVVETESTIYIVTERVQPLSVALSNWAGKSASSKEEWLVWGLHRVAIAVAFVNDTCQSTHGNLRIESVFISPSGEWKLGGFDLLSNPKEDSPVLYTHGTVLPDSAAFFPPEVKANGWPSTKNSDVAAADAYEFGILLHSVFNPTHALPPTTIPPHIAPTASSRGSIPISIFPSYKRLMTPKPGARLTPKAFLQIGLGEREADGPGFFSQNKLVKVCAGLDGFNLSSEADKANLLRTLKESADSFPPEFTSRKVLPSLVTALDFGGASANTILPLVLQLGKSVPPADYSMIVLGPVLKLFASPDRGTRMALLERLPEYSEKLEQRMVTDKIWPHLQTGFGDTVAVIREATLRAISLLAPKLSDRILNNELLKHLAKAQLDPEASIRTNTCILIGRLAPSLATTTQRKVLVPAFSRALKDGFVHARVAGLMALMATMALYEPEDLAGKVIPAMSFALVDKEKLVRDQALKAMELFMKKLESHAATMPETVIPPISSQGENPYGAGVGTTTQASIVNSAAGAAGALAGWAMSSLNKSEPKLATADLQTPMVEAVRPPVTPLAISLTSPVINGLPSLSAPSVPRTINTPKAKGMQLGAAKQPLSKGRASALPFEMETDVQTADAWGDGDLMDVNADTDDWSAFETGPPPLELEDDAWGETLELEEPSEPTPQPAPMSAPPVSRTAVRQISALSDSTRTSAQSLKPLITSRNSTEPVAALISTSPKLPTRPTPATSPAPATDGWDNEISDSEPDPGLPARTVAPVAGSMAGMSKEEKAAEMIRRREERKQRIAALKDQKKGVK